MSEIDNSAFYTEDNLDKVIEIGKYNYQYANEKLLNTVT